MKLIGFVVAIASLSFAMYNMPVWLLKSIFGILGFVASIFICISSEEENEKKNK